jgi:glutamyl-tRNA reductase
MNVVCLGLSHRTATVEQREKFAVADADAGRVAVTLGRTEGLAEAVVVSTCNRVEFYAAAEDPGPAFHAMREYAAGRVDAHDDGIFYKLQAPDSVRHLFRVACGLESMVLGETEILGQVKKAYQAAADAGATARHLNKLFQRAFNVAKEVRTKTNITRGSTSVGSVAADLAEKIFGRLSACKVMILGAGDTSEQTARALLSRGALSIFVSNRSYDRAAALAAEMCGQAIHFDKWHNEMLGIDILIGSTAAPHAIVTREKLEPIMKQRRDRPLFVIDLAVPRDVEPAVNRLDGVYLYDIDSLQAIAQQSLEIRRQDLALCEEMIERHVTEFCEWLARAHLPPSEQAAQMAKRWAVS